MGLDAELMWERMLNLPANLPLLVVFLVKLMKKPMETRKA
jgi:hypothetical protein